VWGRVYTDSATENALSLARNAGITLPAFSFDRFHYTTFCYTLGVMKSALTNDSPNTIIQLHLTPMEARHVLAALRGNVVKLHCGVCADLALTVDRKLGLETEERPCGAAGMNGQPRPRRRH
jgi:hypothetical protein